MNVAQYNDYNIMDNLLYQKIQRVEEGVWVINNGDEIDVLSIPLFIDYSSRKKNSRKQLITVLGMSLLFVIAMYIVYIIFTTFLSIYQGALGK